MTAPTIFILLLLALTIILIAVIIFRPGVTSTRGGKMVAFLVLFALPVLCAGMGGSVELQRAKSTEFCLSCHIMEPYGKSLLVDDPMHLAAAHFQNHRVFTGRSLLYLPYQLRDVWRSESETRWAEAYLCVLSQDAASSGRHQAL